MSAPFDPVDRDDNVYRAPAASLVSTDKGSPLEAATSQGSFIKVTSRKRFTAGFVFSELVVCLVAMLVHPALFVLLFLFLNQASVPFSAGIALAGFGLSWFIMMSFYNGNPRVQRWFAETRSSLGFDFVVELTFTPRLPFSLIEGGDSADDVGILSIAGNSLCYRGDRVEMTLNRKDVALAIRERPSYRGLWMNGPELVIVLDEPLLERRRIRFCIREGFPTTRTIGRARTVTRAIERWFREALETAP